ncbi:MAG: c-type cytochrome, partial [Paracoccaceae bacterium]|nr:c-type cytochrome [Paracoccaceae bacterium]
MKLFAQAAFAAAFIGSASLAGSIAPSDVAFGSDGEVAASLTGVSGDAANGRKLFMNRKKGNCLACHVNSEMSEQSFHGEVGPELDGVAARWNTAELRGILVNSKGMFEG